MPQVKFHVKTVGSKNPQTKQSGFVVRVQNNGTAAMVTPRTTEETEKSEKLKMKSEKSMACCGTPF